MIFSSTIRPRFLLIQIGQQVCWVLIMMALSPCISCHPALPGPGEFVVFMDDTETTDVNERMFDGTFYGVPGTFACSEVSTECRAEMSADGMTLSFAGDWSFTPDGVMEEADLDNIIVKGVVLDMDYMDFGYWLKGNQGRGWWGCLRSAGFCRGSRRIRGRYYYKC